MCLPNYGCLISLLFFLLIKCTKFSSACLWNKNGYIIRPAFDVAWYQFLADKELTNINALSDEYLRLTYHGLRAKDKDFNVTMQTDFDNNIGQINMVPQDIGRVLLNLFNNAFYAVNEKKKHKMRTLKQQFQ